MEILESHKLSNKEVLFTLARVANEFIKMHEDYTFKDDHLDAEAAFNDYLLACRDILSGEKNGGIGVDAPQGN